MATIHFISNDFKYYVHTKDISVIKSRKLVYMVTKYKDLSQSEIAIPKNLIFSKIILKRGSLSLI